MKGKSRMRKTTGKRIWRILGHPEKTALRNAVDWDELLRR